MCVDEKRRACGREAVYMCVDDRAMHLEERQCVYVWTRGDQYVDERRCTCMWTRGRAYVDDRRCMWTRFGVYVDEGRCMCGREDVHVWTAVHVGEVRSYVDCCACGRGAMCMWTRGGGCGPEAVHVDEKQ